MRNRKRYIVEELRVIKRVVRAHSYKEIEAQIASYNPKTHKIVSLVIKKAPIGTKSLLHKQDFIEMLKRGDTFEQIAQVAKVKVSSVETRYFRLSKAERPQIKRDSSKRSGL